MQSLIIEGTKKTPSVEFLTDGKLLLRGRSIPEDPSKFYDLLLQWATDYSKEPHANTIVDVALEYFNSGTSKALLHILRVFVDMKGRGANVTMRWHYEAGDDDIYERGDYYSTLLETEFEFIEEKSDDERF